MDIFRFDNPNDPTLMEQGVIVNGLTSKMWIERYAASGEFTLKAPANSIMRNKLPIGSFISHTDTSELMIVENHEINDVPDQDSELIITGRGFETFFENRIVGSNKTYPSSGDPVEYVLSADYTWNQAVTLIQQHIYAFYLVDDNDAIPFTEVLTGITGTGISVERSIKRGDLYTRLLELLAIDNLGIRVTRPGPRSPLIFGNPDVAIEIHIGVDRRAQIVFSHDTGEIGSADYLWSNKKTRNTAMVSGRWVETLVTTPETEYNRRMMFVDASDIDNQLTAPPTGTDLDNVVAAMQQRGISALSSQSDVALTKAEVSNNTNKAAYRRDFNVGDIITVSGDYNESSAMRISEYVEIEDENGKSGYPTLTLL